MDRERGMKVSPSTPAANDLVAGLEALAHAGHAAEGLIALHALLPKAQTEGDTALEARLLLLRGAFERISGRFTEARDSLQQAAGLFTSQGDLVGYANVAHQLSAVSLDLGAFDEAVESALDGLSVLARQDTPLVRSRLLRSLGTAICYAEDFDQAESLLRESVELARVSGQESALAHPLYRLAQVSIAREERARATSVFDTDAADATSVDAAAASPPSPLGASPWLTRAREEIEQAYAIALRAGRRRIEGLCLIELARIETLDGRVSEAVNAACRAITIFRALPAPRSEGQALCVLARAHLAADDSPEAIRCAMMSLHLARSHGLRPVERDAYLALAECLEASGDTAAALKWLKRARALEQALRTGEVLRRCQRLHYERVLEASRVERELLEAEKRSLTQLAVTDPLTGLANRRGIETFFLHHAATRRRVALLALDIDHFKSINDRYGHTVGDRVLERFAEILKQHCRSTDCAGRWGGEEFVLLVEEVALEAAIEVAERIRRAIDTDWTALAPALRVTTSIGIAFATAPTDLETLFARADRALYAAKAQGRNRVVLAPDDATQPATVPPVQNDATTST